MGACIEADATSAHCSTPTTSVLPGSLYANQPRLRRWSSFHPAPSGALLILVAFAMAQFGYLKQSSRIYLVLKLVGSVILAVLPWHEEQLGFLLLEGVRALVSAGEPRAGAARASSDRPALVEQDVRAIVTRVR